jgi:phospholipase C
MLSFRFCFLSMSALSLLPLAGCAGLRPVPPPTTTQSFRLTVTAPPAGQGTIVSSPAGISCPTTCTATFTQGTKVTLTAKPGTSYLFEGWSGACSGMSCTVTLNAATTVSASFIAVEGISVALAGNGSGKVTSTPAGINCPTTCSSTFPDKTQVTLSETPGSNSYFGGWSGACTGTTACSLTVTTAENVTASFTGPDALTVTTSGTGAGTVTSMPTGISCASGSTTGCSATFPPGTPVSLSESPNPNDLFSGWTGACQGTGSCSITLTAATTAVTATFGLPGTLQSLNHIIFFAQENRSLDHYFGYMEQYWANNGSPQIAAGTTFDGLPQFNPSPGPAPTEPGCDPADPPPAACVADGNGTPVPSFHMQSVCTEELSPFWDEAHVDWNVDFDFPNTIDWLGNGFVQAGANDARQYPLSSNGGNPVNDVMGYRTMGYFTDADLNYYYYMATQFATSDRWFAPMLTRTQLNRAYIYAATSQGHVYPLTSTSPAPSPLTAMPFVEALQKAGVSWAIYVETSGTSCDGETGDQLSECLLQGYSYLNEFTYQGVIMASAGQNPDLLKNIRPTSQLASDMQNDQTFPQVVLIEPASDAGLDEHPSDSDEYPENIQKGARYAAGIINSFMGSNVWKDSAMIFTYDEPGGFYDHVQPQVVPVPDSYASPTDLTTGDACLGADQTTGVCSFGMTGYRVPLIVVSPFAKKNYVSHTVRDTTAWLNFVEERFNVPALTARDAYWSTTTPLATMDEFFDFANPQWITPPTPPTQSTGGTCSTAAPTP